VDVRCSCAHSYRKPQRNDPQPRDVVQICQLCNAHLPQEFREWTLDRSALLTDRPARGGRGRASLRARSRAAPPPSLDGPPLGLQGEPLSCLFVPVLTVSCCCRFTCFGSTFPLHAVSLQDSPGNAQKTVKIDRSLLHIGSSAAPLLELFKAATALRSNDANNHSLSCCCRGVCCTAAGAVQGRHRAVRRRRRGDAASQPQGRHR